MPAEPDDAIDLRDEVQFLRELVEKLVTEVKLAREVTHVAVMPLPIIIERPVVPQQPQWLQDRWYTNWITEPATNTICSTAGTTRNLIQWNVTDQGPDPDGAGVPVG